MILTGLARTIEKARRPPHIGIPRARMNVPFAVQLMRTSYEAADELDFVPMDEFQKTFFKFRQSEWEDYMDYHPRVMQGDLAETLYFDFISFAQYAVIAEKIKKGRMKFVEKVDAEGRTEVVSRMLIYESNAKLPYFHSELVGNKLLDFLQEKYPTVAPSKDALERLKNDKTKPLSAFVEQAQLVMDLFVINNYAVTGSIRALPMVADKKDNKDNKDNMADQVLGLEVVLKAPAILWSFQMLWSRKDEPVNDFEVKVLQALARRMDPAWRVETVSSQVSDQIVVTHILKLRRVG